MKRIIDVTCGSKMMWFDKNNPDVEFCDIRNVPLHEYYPNRYLEVNPDTIADFRDLPFPDESFYLCLFDPPHVDDFGKTSFMRLKYGCLEGNWREDISKGFDECMRVLKPNGVLVFKWSERKFALSEILPLFSKEPLFGQRVRKNEATHWLCFMKEDKAESSGGYNEQHLPRWRM